MAEVARKLALQKAGLWQPSPEEQREKDRLRRLVNKNWNSYEEKEWLDNTPDPS